MIDAPPDNGVNRPVVCSNMWLNGNSDSTRWRGVGGTRVCVISVLLTMFLCVRTTPFGLPVVPGGEHQLGSVVGAWPAARRRRWRQRP